ncbi:hypothetical protein SDC9_89173 [bioreactor metagenome]|uniref:Uncharacterized protein n=1 Tax=bioreactor metagenome TaxID=1076179 RepID=A0A644ZQ47_9ZZZZ
MAVEDLTTFIAAVSTVTESEPVLSLSFPSETTLLGSTVAVLAKAPVLVGVTGKTMEMLLPAANITTELPLAVQVNV